MNQSAKEEFVFVPPRQGGRLFHIGLILILLAGGALGLYLASQAQIGPIFLLSLLPGLLAVILVPILAYNLYCLQTAYYILERDGLRLRWGLRMEEIPMNAIIWVHTQDELVVPLPFPLLRLPGAVVGNRQISGAARQAGAKSVEYMASKTRGLVLIGTPESIFAISPQHGEQFLYIFQRLTELGSLTPLEARSVHPTFLLARLWASRWARLLILTSLMLSLALLAWVALAIPSHLQVNLGFHPDGSPGDTVPAVQLLLLPVLNSLIVLVDIFIGIFFYRREETQDLSYLIWGSGAIIPLLFLIGAFFILGSI
jgi:hypothetical protein